jgi:thiamine-phosphate pyrophosphorylase
VFSTQHKDDAKAPLGIEGYSALRRAAAQALGDLPVGAIAGIDAGNAGSVIGAGADGVAVIGALFAAEDITAAARALRAAVDAALTRRLAAPV